MIHFNRGICVIRYWCGDIADRRYHTGCPAQKKQELAVVHSVCRRSVCSGDRIISARHTAFVRAAPIFKHWNDTTSVRYYFRGTCGKCCIEHLWYREYFTKRRIKSPKDTDTHHAGFRYIRYNILGNVCVLEDMNGYCSTNKMPYPIGTEW